MRVGIHLASFLLRGLIFNIFSITNSFANGKVLKEVSMKKKVIGLALIMMFVIPVSSNALTPLESVKADINKVLDVLRDPTLKGESGKKIKNTKIRALSREMFDFTELSRRTLALNWNKFNAAQQKEFVDLYSLLLEETYADKILSYTNEKVLYSKEYNLTENTVEVKTTIVTKQGDVPINYRVIRKGSEWKVYDVVVEGVSLISNYRSQFREILINKPPESLIDTLRKKVGK
jgi:phospholipid transport system substrate-binding protein